MNDFLKNLRSQQKEKFGVSYRSNGEKSNYPHPDRRSGNDRRAGTSSARSHLSSDMLTKKISELVPEFKSLMIAMADTNDRMADIMDRFVMIEEQRNIIYAAIAESVASIAEKGIVSSESGSGNGEFRKTKKIPREERNKIMDLIFNMRENGSTYEQISEYLEDEKIPTFSNKGHWHAQTIHRLYQQRKKELRS